MQISPQTILSGLGTLSRREMCDVLALFEDTKLSKIVADKINKLIEKGRGIEGLSNDLIFKERLGASSDKLESSPATNRALRFRLWCQCRSAFDLDSAIPLSTRTANTFAADLAQSAAELLHLTSSSDESQKSDLYLPTKVWKTLKSKIFSERADFTTVVKTQAVRMVAEAAINGTLSDEAKSELVKRIRSQLEALPPELRDRAVEHAISSGDVAALTLLASGTSLVSLGIAVNLAGFGAYIFAAQAAAVIPLLSGPAAVSALFVLSSPVFILPALLGGAFLTGKKFNKSVQKKFVSTLITQLALKGISVGKEGLRHCLDDFKTLSAADLASLPAEQVYFFTQKLQALKQQMGSELPPTPWESELIFAATPQGQIFDTLERALFPLKDDLAKEAILVGSLTLGDIVYYAAAIDPTVLKAADFSRTEDLSNIFNFGAFANRASALSSVSHMGIENNLRGYVAEQLVAARLVEQGCQVTFPDTSNNPGFDLLVDGKEFQVKCLSGLSGLREHFETYPDMPVLTNADLASAISDFGESWVDKVFFVEGYDFESTNFITKTALESGAAIGEMAVPILAIAVSAARNIHGWWRGSLPLKDLPFEIVMRSAIKGSLATAGGFAGNTIGLLVFGPAGAVVFGGVGGTAALLGSNWTRQQINQRIVGEWLNSLDKSTERFRSSLRAALIQKIEMLNGKIAQITAQRTEQASWFNSRLADNALTLAEYLWELDEVVPQEDKMTKAKSCLRIMNSASVHPWSVNGDLSNLMKVLSERPKLSTAALGKAGFALNGAVNLAKGYLKKSPI